jgi:hypothetical protein
MKLLHLRDPIRITLRLNYGTAHDLITIKLIGFYRTVLKMRLTHGDNAVCRSLQRHRRCCREVSTPQFAHSSLLAVSPSFLKASTALTALMWMATRCAGGRPFYVDLLTSADLHVLPPCICHSTC